LDDTQAEIDLPHQSESDQTPSELNRSESIVPTDASIEPPPAVAVGTNGSSPRKIEANRRNAQKSTGPKTERGKAMSSWNSSRHGLLSNRLPLLYGRSKKQFTRLLRSLQKDLEPVGTLEEVLVEKIAHEYWRVGVAAFHEAADLSRDNPFKHTSIDRLVRYQTTINRQLFQAMNQLERLQRLRKGDNVLAPLTLEVAHDTGSLPAPTNRNDDCDPLVVLMSQSQQRNDEE
jgi:hypothetical protein